MLTTTTNLDSELDMDADLTFNNQSRWSRDRSMFPKFIVYCV